MAEPPITLPLSGRRYGDRPCAQPNPKPMPPSHSRVLGRWRAIRCLRACGHPSTQKAPPIPAAACLFPAFSTCSVRTAGRIVLPSPAILSDYGRHPFRHPLGKVNKPVNADYGISDSQGGNRRPLPTRSIAPRMLCGFLKHVPKGPGSVECPRVKL